MTMPKITSAGSEIARHALGPARQLLRNEHPANQPVDSMLDPLVRQLRNWRYSRKETGPVGLFKNLVLSNEEAEAVYGAFDKAFDATFHGIETMGRHEASLFVERLVLDVGAKLKGAGTIEESDMTLLQGFLAHCEGLLEDVEIRPINA